MDRTPTTRTTRTTAVVIGGRVAGLSAAAVLAARFSSVVVVEPQARHDGPAGPEGLPRAGLERLEGWFPGLAQDLLDAGAPAVDLGGDVSWFEGGGYRPRFTTGMSTPLASPTLLEHHLRLRALALPNVTLRSGPGVTGLVTTPDRATVTGVTLDDGTTLQADLVVDASGRGAPSLRWLRELGYPAPPTSHVSIDATYASRVVRLRPGPRPDWKLALVNAGPPSGRQGVAVAIEDDRWLVTLTGTHGERPPADDDGFLAFARSLPAPDVAQLLEAAVPAGPIVTHRVPSNQRRHLERLRRVPAGLLLLGDSLCSVNPTSGQGASIAALQAEALGQALDRVPGTGTRLVRDYYRRAARAVTPAWQLTTGADFTLPATTGPKAAGTDLLNRYMAHVRRASQVDEAVALRMIEVTSLMRPPEALHAPSMVVRVIRAARRPAPRPARMPVPQPQPVAA